MDLADQRGYRVNMNGVGASKFVKDERYEFQAPKWVDFRALNQSDYHSEDDSWFCRPKCNHSKDAIRLVKDLSTRSNERQHVRSAGSAPPPPSVSNYKTRPENSLRFQKGKNSRCLLSRSVDHAYELQSKSSALETSGFSDVGRIKSQKKKPSKCYPKSENVNPNQSMHISSKGSNPGKSRPQITCNESMFPPLGHSSSEFVKRSTEKPFRDICTDNDRIYSKREKGAATGKDVSTSSTSPIGIAGKNQTMKKKAAKLTKRHKTVQIPELNDANGTERKVQSKFARQDSQISVELSFQSPKYFKNCDKTRTKLDFTSVLKPSKWRKQEKDSREQIADCPKSHQNKHTKNPKTPFVPPSTQKVSGFSEDRNGGSQGTATKSMQGQHQRLKKEESYCPKDQFHTRWPRSSANLRTLLPSIFSRLRLPLPDKI